MCPERRASGHIATSSSHVWPLDVVSVQAARVPDARARIQGLEALPVFGPLIDWPKIEPLALDPLPSCSRGCRVSLDSVRPLLLHDRLYFHHRNSTHARTIGLVQYVTNRLVVCLSIGTSAAFIVRVRKPGNRIGSGAATIRMRQPYDMVSLRGLRDVMPVSRLVPSRLEKEPRNGGSWGSLLLEIQSHMVVMDLKRGLTHGYLATEKRHRRSINGRSLHSQNGPSACRRTLTVIGNRYAAVS